MVEQHDSLAENKQNKEKLLGEIEDFGFQIGVRAVDYLGMTNQEAYKQNLQLDAVRFLVKEVWLFVFPSESEPTRET